MPFHYVYILQNPEGLLYTGCTYNLRGRMIEHFQGKSFHTKDRGPYKLVYYEACLNSKDAYSREKYLKSGAGKRYIKNRIKHYKEAGMNPVTTQKSIRVNSKVEVYSRFQTSLKYLKESEL